VSNLLKKEKGFTLIEIVLVLAIAGLLLVIVFLAVSGAQKNRRDTQRKDDLSRIAAQIEAFASNNNGCYPQSAGAGGCAASVPTWATFSGSTYITGGNFNSPSSGGGYTYAAAGTWPATAALDNVYYRYGTYCDGTGGGTARGYSVRMGLEQGDACRDTK
jgi:prepilin-type N-terminal cleavage/methylation domain-containing protein